MADEEAQRFEITEQEEKCEQIFNDLKRAFKKLEKITKPDKLHAAVKDITNKLKEAKALIKDFEREARADGMPAKELAERKKVLAQELNSYIQMKKDFAQGEGTKSELLNGAAQGEIEMALEGMTMQQLMTKGRKDIDETNAALGRAERIVEETKDVGKNIAGTVHDQTKQLEKIVDDLNEIEFDMKKATKVIRDITRGLLTDKCIAFLLLLVVVGVVAIIVVKIINPNKDKVKQGANAIVNSTVNSQFGNSTLTAIQGGLSQAGKAVNNTFNDLNSVAPTGRRMLLDFLWQLLNDD